LAGRPPQSFFSPGLGLTRTLTFESARLDCHF
jgi:hypothetical protein